MSKSMILKAAIAKSDCIFCRIVAKQAPSYTFFEDEKHIAFLSIFPNTPGVSVVIPKKHYSSDIFSLDDNVLTDLTIAAKSVSNILTKKLDGVARVGLVYEGYGINHAHAKLFPMHDTEGNAGENWQPIKSIKNDFFEKYPGYISSHDSNHLDNKDLQEMYNRLVGEDTNDADIIN